jgi:DNA-binding transcriptional MerR regulator
VRVERLTIGALANAGGVNVETIRYYERRGLLPPPDRSGAGYRQYSADDLWRLGFIRRAKGLGFTLAEIAELLGRHTERSVVEVLAAARTKLAEVEADIASLVTLRSNLRRLVQTLETGDMADCLDLSLNADDPGCC